MNIAIQVALMSLREHQTELEEAIADEGLEAEDQANALSDIISQLEDYENEYCQD